jgi:hypothetical protein
MSAFMCDDRHISALAYYVDQRRAQFGGLDNHDTPEAIGAELHLENAASIAFRYPDGGMSPSEPFSLERVAVRDANPLQVINAAWCYQYQACEHPAWDESLSRRITDQIVKVAIRTMPGYSGASWGWPSEEEEALKIAAVRAKISRDAGRL